jgi:hypothetical protein
MHCLTKLIPAGTMHVDRASRNEPTNSKSSDCSTVKTSGHPIRIPECYVCLQDMQYELVLNLQLGHAMVIACDAR